MCTYFILFVLDEKLTFTIIWNTSTNKVSACTLGKDTFFLYSTNSAKTIDGVTAIFAIW